MALDGNTISYSNGNGSYQMFSRDLLTNDWNRLAVTFDGSIFKMYLNGVLLGSCESAKCIKTKFFVGGQANSPNNSGGTKNGYVNGIYKNIRVYNVALDADQL